MSLIIKNLSVEFDKNLVLDQIDLAIKDKEFVSLVGGSGSGKTTLLKNLAGLVECKSGRVYIKGKEVTGLGTNKRNISYVFQDLRLFPHLTVYENIAFPLRMNKVPKKDHKDRIFQLLDMVQMSGFETYNVNDLSGGQQQRIALARALAIEPDLLLLDEPFSGLDENLRLEMGQLVKNLHENGNFATIMVTHDPREAIRYSDRIALLHKGKIHQFASPDDLLAKPLDLFAAQYFTDINIIRGQIKNGTFSSPLASWPLAKDLGDSLKDQGNIMAIFRPANACLIHDKDWARHRAIEVRVKDTIVSPNDIKVFVRPQGLDEDWTINLLASSENLARTWKDQTSYLDLDPDKLWYVRG